MKGRITIAEMFIVVVAVVALSLIVDSFVHVHPIDSSLWAGEHNNLGQWLPWKHLRTIEFGAGLVMFAALVGTCIFTVVRGSNRNGDQPNKVLAA